MIKKISFFFFFVAIGGLLYEIFFAEDANHFDIDHAQRIDSEQSFTDLPVVIFETSIAEVSGIVWCEEAFFIVSDTGWIYRLDYGAVTQAEELKGDLEGVTCKDHRLWAIVENTGNVFEVSRDFKESKKHKDFINIGSIRNNARNGFEGISAGPEESFFAVTQSRGIIYHVNHGEVIQKKKLPYDDLSGIDYDGTYVYVISDTHNILLMLNQDLDVVHEQKIPGKNQEGLAVHDGVAHIVQDDQG